MRSDSDARPAQAPRARALPSARPPDPASLKEMAVALGAHIRDLQAPDGRIVWVDKGVWDPWNHCEAAMGLSVIGDLVSAERALNALIDTQASDGFWRADMGCAAPMDPENRHIDPRGAPQIVDTNFCAYVAVFVWHLAVITQDKAVIDRAAPMVAQAFEWLLGRQTPTGVFPWCAELNGAPSPDAHALLAGNASIALSLTCAIAVLRAAQRPVDHLRRSLAALVTALHPSGALPCGMPSPIVDKSQHAMDWYYPILAGLRAPALAQAELDAHWSAFVDTPWGCRCVKDEPWATAAETAELAIACVRAGRREAAQTLLTAVARHAAPQGGLWTGRQFAENRPWPEDRPSWTAGAALIALDAVNALTPGAAIFTTLSPYDAVRPARVG